MKFPIFMRITVDHFAKTMSFHAHVAFIKDIISHFDDCGWSGADCYMTEEGFIQVRINDEQDMINVEYAMNSFFSRFATVKM
jgi:hypothetical protein